MKILIIRNYPTYFDIKNLTYNIQEIGLAKALVRAGAECDIVFWTSGVDEQTRIDVDGKFITVYYISAKNILKNGVFPERLETLASKYDVIQCCEYNQYQAYKFSKRFRNNMVILHGPYYSKFNVKYNTLCAVFDLFFKRRYIILNTHFITKSELAFKFLNSKGIRKENISTIGVGIDREALTDKNEGSNNSLPEFVTKVQAINKKTLLYIGKIEPRRKSLFLLDVFKRVREKCDCTLVVVGNGESEYLAAFNEKIKALGLEHDVYHADKLEQKYLSYIYKKADIFLLPTEFEIFGMVLLEAMYFKTAAITSYNGGSSTLIENGVDGIIIDDFGEEHWAMKITELLSSPEKLAQIGECSCAKITEKYTWDSLAPKYLEAYGNAIKKQ